MRKSVAAAGFGAADALTSDLQLTTELTHQGVQMMMMQLLCPVETSPLPLTQDTLPFLHSSISNLLSPLPLASPPWPP